MRDILWSMHGWGSLRRWSTVIALACAAPALVAVGCGAFGGSDTSAGSEDAGSAAESGGADASLPSSDAGSEGGAVTFCDTVVGAAFCADFDRGSNLIAGCYQGAFGKLADFCCWLTARIVKLQIVKRRDSRRIAARIIFQRGAFDVVRQISFFHLFE